MDNNSYRDLNNKVSGFEFEFSDIMSRLATKTNSLEQAMADLNEKVDQFDDELGFWDAVPKSLLF